MGDLTPKLQLQSYYKATKLQSYKATSYDPKATSYVATKETGLASETFPDACPYAAEQVLLPGLSPRRRRVAVRALA